ncbi:hypothetical protein FHS29_005214 [Saccharothrix tamanrassetensis]|uniref:FHA domain-containing protein n=1 Tax=Saccharothrix tamanrassetensis TaxID=1051531 RepID=A0A841CT46_9PSEU|nr:FHA domain-containing protein [Saccharothrix tamanrassetensis]MBB5958606.1 hypothetical protein [Saccharothrix tamanrassetensis]
MVEVGLVCVGRDGVRRAVVATVGPEHRVAELALALGCREALYLGPVALPGWLPLGEAGIANGTVLGLDAPPPVDSGAAVGGGTREVAVVGGLHGGPSTTLYPVGELRIGRAPDAGLVLADAEVSRRHARLVISAGTGRVRLEDTGSHNGVRWRGWLLEGSADLLPGDVAGLGETVIGLREVVPADAESTAGPDGVSRVFHRPAERPVPVAPDGERMLRARDPDPTMLLGIARGPSARLWERRRADPDFLRLRLGLHDRPAEVRMPFAEPAPVLHAVPVTADLGEAGVLGLAGPRDALLASARAVVAQAAVLCAPDDLVIVLVTGPRGAPAWEWAGWLPHTRPPVAAFDCSRLVATDEDQARARLGELRALVARRRAASRFDGARVLVVLDGVRRLHGIPGLAEVLDEGPAAGVTALCLAEDEDALPAACGTTLVSVNESGSRAELRYRGFPAVADVLVDGLLPEHAMRLALALAPIVMPAGGPRQSPGAEGDLSVRPRLVTELGRPTGRVMPDRDDTTAAVVTADVRRAPDPPAPQEEVTVAHLRSRATGRVDR